MSDRLAQIKAKPHGESVAWLIAEVERLRELLPAEDWCEEDGTVLWWHLPVQEPPYIGAHECMGERFRGGEPTDCARLQRSGWLTHWSRIPDVGDERDVLSGGRP